ncbi:MAG: response regulator [Caulobacterales bacterium]
MTLPDFPQSVPDMTVEPDHTGSFLQALRDKARVLFVDDDPILREFAAVNLAGDQWEVELAGDGGAALTAIEQASVDVVLLDLEMPSMDGFKVLKALRGAESWRRLPVIAMTGREDLGGIERAFHAGATSFTVKPINWRLLASQVRYVLRASRAELAQSPSQAQIASDADETAQQLQRLARESSRFLAVALAQASVLRPAAVEFARIVDEVLKAAPPSRAA